MDGNGRWASRRGLPRTAGHRAGALALRRVVEHAPGTGIRCLTLYAFSSDNWRRPADEVRGIFALLGTYLRSRTSDLIRNGVRLQIIGRRDRLPQAALLAIEQAERATRECTRLHLRIAIDYSSREAIARAAANAAHTAESCRSALATALAGECGEVDLLIRTGGEKRLSDFLLWESAYAELVFTDCMWPDFGKDDLDEALREFGRRERRFGGVPLATPAGFSPTAA
jgi:undecaprenyl diphosphate synthase